MYNFVTHCCPFTLAQLDTHLPSATFIMSNRVAFNIESHITKGHGQTKDPVLPSLDLAGAQDAVGQPGRITTKSVVSKIIPNGCLRVVTHAVDTARFCAGG